MPIHISMVPITLSMSSINSIIVLYRSRLDVYQLNCRYQYRHQMKADPSVTAFLDWTDDELTQLGDLSVKYSHNSVFHDPIPVLYNN